MAKLNGEITAVSMPVPMIVVRAKKIILAITALGMSAMRLVVRIRRKTMVHIVASMNVLTDGVLLPSRLSPIIVMCMMTTEYPKESGYKPLSLNLGILLY